MNAAGVAASAGLLLLVTAGCVQTYDGNGVLAEETRPERDFDRVSARGSFEVELTPGDFEVGVHIDQNLLSRILTSVDDRTLVIRVDDGNIRDHLPGPNITVSMPSLTDVELIGAGKLVARGFEDETASVELTGRGEVSWSGSTEALDVVLNGSGTLTLEGEARRADYYLGGAGVLDARDLTAEGATIEVKGAGLIQATVDGRVDATVEGTGAIELYGDVTRGTWTETEEGSISEP